jgi:hypothetical protein
LGGRKGKNNKLLASLGLLAAGAVITLLVTQGWNFTIGDLGKKAVIDYSFQNGDEKFRSTVVCYMYDPNEPANQQFESSRLPTAIPIYLRNNGDAYGSISVTLSAIGAKVSNSQDGNFLQSSFTAQINDVANDKTWHDQGSLFVKPDKDQQIITLTLTATGVGNTQTHPQPITSYALDKNGIAFQCKT